MQLSEYSALIKLFLVALVVVIVFRKLSAKRSLKKTLAEAEKTKAEATMNYKLNLPREKAARAYLEKDYATALQEWKPLAEQGDVDAQYSLGNMYLKGEGVLQNYKIAISWFQPLAKHGHADAQYSLGNMYLKGQGVTQDPICAHMWFNLAASQGHEGATEGRGLAENEMTVSQVEEAQELAREFVLSA